MILSVFFLLNLLAYSKNTYKDLVGPSDPFLTLSPHAFAKADQFLYGSGYKRKCFRAFEMLCL